MTDAPTYHCKQWRTTRATILARDGYTCQICGCILSEGRKGKRSAVVDHKRPAELRPDLFFDPDNLWAVCKADHDKVCQAIEKTHWPDVEGIARRKAAYRPVGLDGYPVRA